ncbi:hypothetical protein K435DRAFT_788171 [Dendrothele bispora CBS 962.96]|uniref:Uncharacterized protein n=1 Tax=Dendrothele bispora (strain CBS 962.96) TaxID=1314807 RepID=A0A4S8MWT8_DENBC|nr:hypothetical protein K435DRAFT_788171 [Dendrothele bispora CBS 962.96]
MSRPRPRPRTQTHSHRGFFTSEKNLQRATYNAVLVYKVKDAYRRGRYRSRIRPLTHPAHRHKTHPLLQQWDVSINPRGHNRASQHLEFYDTPIGLAIRHLHSTRGIPITLWREVRSQEVVCSVCSCSFSRDGYIDHLSNDICRNWHVARQVKSLPSGAPAPPVITEPSESPFEEWFDHMAPSLIALIEWNSRVGIPRDVWTLVSTSEKHCPDCKLIIGINWYLDRLDSSEGKSPTCTTKTQSLLVNDESYSVRRSGFEI